MAAFFQFLEVHAVGFFVLISCFFAAALFIQWIAWILARGRFAATDRQEGSRSTLRYVVSEFFVRIINEFRHLLALVLVVVFALTLAAAIYPGVANKDVEAIGKGLEFVAATLGGLLGSVLGYYFGESKRKPLRGTPGDVTQPSNKIEQVPPPPKLEHTQVVPTTPPKP
jgi:hypothetical protein